MNNKLKFLIYIISIVCFLCHLTSSWSEESLESQNKFQIFESYSMTLPQHWKKSSLFDPRTQKEETVLYLPDLKGLMMIERDIVEGDEQAFLDQEKFNLIWGVPKYFGGFDHLERIHGSSGHFDVLVFRVKKIEEKERQYHIILKPFDTQLVKVIACIDPKQKEVLLPIIYGAIDSLENL